MNATQTTKAPVQRPPKAAAAPTIDQVKAKLLADAHSAYLGLQGAQECGESGDAGARLLACAEGALVDSIQMAERRPMTSVSASAWLNKLYTVQAYLEGAMALDGDSPRGITTQAPYAIIQRLITALDRPDWPTESYEDAYARDFMAGKSLGADLLDAAIAAEAEGDHSELLAYYRGRDTTQKEFVRPFFDAVRADPSLADGFFAVLSGHLICAPEAGAVPDSVRSASYEDCVGGPDTKYMAEDMAEAGEALASREVSIGQAASTSSAEFHGMNTAQVVLVLEQIASMALTLREQAITLNGEYSTTVGDAFRQVELTAATIGALADTPLGGEIGGSFPGWLIGSPFTRSAR